VVGLNPTVKGACEDSQQKLTLLKWYGGGKQDRKSKREGEQFELGTVAS